MLDFLKDQAFTILSTIILAIIGYIGTQVKKIYEEYINNKTKKHIVETVVKAVEQVYKDLDGPEKLEKAKENIILMLQEKGITITEIELDMLIESVVAEFNFISMSTVLTVNPDIELIEEAEG